MPRTHIQHTANGTVAHGYVIEGGKAVFASFDIEGKRLSVKSAENHVRRKRDPTFAIESITHYRKLYRMPISQFVESAELYDIQEGD
jgi:hypothetical protein